MYCRTERDTLVSSTGIETRMNFSDDRTRKKRTARGEERREKEREREKERD